MISTPQTDIVKIVKNLCKFTLLPMHIITRWSVCTICIEKYIPSYSMNYNHVDHVNQSNTNPLGIFLPQKRQLVIAFITLCLLTWKWAGNILINDSKCTCHFSQRIQWNSIDVTDMCYINDQHRNTYICWLIITSIHLNGCWYKKGINEICSRKVN